MNSLLLIGLAVFWESFQGKSSRRLKSPGRGLYPDRLVVGKSFLHIFEDPVIEGLMPVVNFTLGIIGFIIGGYLKRDVFSKYGKSVYAILLGERIARVFAGRGGCHADHQETISRFVIWSHCLSHDPASTTNVLWEYRSKGPLTTTLAPRLSLLTMDSRSFFTGSPVFSRKPWLLKKVFLSFTRWECRCGKFVSA
jgi:hypothetical protein